jgi:hypothetical protein
MKTFGQLSLGRTGNNFGKWLAFERRAGLIVD